MSDKLFTIGLDNGASCDEKFTVNQIMMNKTDPGIEQQIRRNGFDFSIANLRLRGLENMIGNTGLNSDDMELRLRRQSVKIPDKMRIEQFIFLKTLQMRAQHGLQRSTRFGHVPPIY